MSSATGLVELDLLTLMPRSDDIVDLDIMEDRMLVKLAASLASNQVVTRLPPVPQLETLSQHADSTLWTPPTRPASLPVSPWLL